MADNLSAVQGRTVIGQVAGYTPESGTYYVKYPGMSGDQTKGFPAQLMSPTPFTDGGGLKSVSKVPIDTPCLLYNFGRRWVIMGFLTPQGAVVNDTHFQTRPTSPGETFLTHNSGSRHGFTSNGSILSWASNTLNMIFNPMISQMSAFFKNMYVNWFAGYVSYIYDNEKKTSKFTLQVKKDLDLSAITPGSVQKDRVTMHLGALEDTHIADIYVKQEFDIAKKPGYEFTGKLGKQKDGTWLDILSKLGGTTSDTTFKMKVDTTGKVQVESKAKDEKTSIAMKLDPVGTDVVEIKVNGDKATITISSDGSVVIKQDPLAKLYLGGKDKAQQLVTKAFIDQIYLNHIHMTAAPGAPTTPPTMPPIIPIPSDSATGPLTYTTYAE